MAAIQIASDIHLEMFKDGQEAPRIEPVAPVLALLGDIGYPESAIYREFLAAAARDFEHVLVLAGNHEYYTTTVQGGDCGVEAACAAHGNVHFLQKRRLALDAVPGVVFLGCTLWAAFPDDLKKKAAQCVGDFKWVQWEEEGAGRRGFGVDDVQRLHDDHRAWLEAELEAVKKEGKQAVVLTHHAPTDYKTMKGENVDDVNKAMHACHVEELFLPPCVLWCFGHTHHNMNCMVRCDRSTCDSDYESDDGGDPTWWTRLATNQLGYVHTHGASPGYAPAHVIPFPIAPDAAGDLEVVEYSQLALGSMLNAAAMMGAMVN
eukprot:TRINITY_DN16703_c0_g1_i1.p1 TRINITY_DN16703_c0_g1~~TRINITY_DN16703_c0_g1_i1.p1  ORF type:complete len:318 (+),score=117.89 TRINITY_DN16703_c0_g1_i1:171-1124(+)